MRTKTTNINYLASAVALRDIDACAISSIGIIAGTHHFVDLWARDSLFATFGANVSGMKDVSKKTIETFLQFQRDDGLVPFLIRRSSLSIGKYFGRHTYYDKPRAQFRSSQSGGIVLDGGLMTVIAAKALGDRGFFKKHRQAIRKAMSWYGHAFGDQLISEWFQCEWADAVLKRGKTLYTNVLYWKALGDAGLLVQQTALGKKIRSELWNGTFFSDWKSVFRHDYFSSHANMLAIVFGLAQKKEAESILQYAKVHCWNGWTLETNYPRYPLWRIPLGNYCIGMADYHNRGCLWLQPGILYAIALSKSGRNTLAKQVIRTIADKIIEHDGVYEVYEKNGTPVTRFFYRSEQPFAWSAGLFLYAGHIL